MRIEKVSNKSYAKILDKTEHGLINVINKYFNSNTFNTTNNNGMSPIDKETLIQEIINRIYPIIISTSETIYERELERVIEECIRTCASMCPGGGGTAVSQHIIYTTIITPSDSKRIITLPESKYMTIATGDIDVRINGAEQESPLNYSYVLSATNSTTVTGFNFGSDILIVGDVVAVEYANTPITRTTEYVKVISEVDDKRYVYLESSYNFMLDNPIRVLVNGVEQDGSHAYDIIRYPLKPTRLWGIDFLGEVLGVYDVVTIGY